jgi:hypothetical protein
VTIVGSCSAAGLHPRLFWLFLNSARGQCSRPTKGGRGEDLLSCGSTQPAKLGNGPHHLRFSVMTPFAAQECQGIPKMVVARALQEVLRNRPEAISVGFP